MRAWVGELDAAICAEPRLAELGGRFWFSLDDGRADVSGLGADVGVHALDDGVALLLAGRDSGVRLAVGDVARSLVALAVRFIEVRGKAWRVNELADIRELLPGAEMAATTFPLVTKAPVGWIGQQDGRVALGAAVPLGALPARVAECLASIGAAVEAPLVITPWRSVLVCDLDEAVATKHALLGYTDIPGVTDALRRRCSLLALLPAPEAAELMVIGSPVAPGHDDGARINL